MKKSQPFGFVNQLLICTLVLICFSGSIGLGTVWMRQQMAQTANSIKTNHARAIEIERRLDETRAAITAEQTTEILERRNAEWNLGLMMPREMQIARVRENAEQRLARKNQAERFAALKSAPSVPAEEPLFAPVRFALNSR